MVNKTDMGHSRIPRFAIQAKESNSNSSATCATTGVNKANTATASGPSATRWNATATSTAKNGFGFSRIGKTNAQPESNGTRKATQTGNRNSTNKMNGQRQPGSNEPPNGTKNGTIRMSASTSIAALNGEPNRPNGTNAVSILEEGNRVSRTKAVSRLNGAASQSELAVSQRARSDAPLSNNVPRQRAMCVVSANNAAAGIASTFGHQRPTAIPIATSRLANSTTLRPTASNEQQRVLGNKPSRIPRWVAGMEKVQQSSPSALVTLADKNSLTQKTASTDNNQPTKDEGAAKPVSAVKPLQRLSSDSETASNEKTSDSHDAELSPRKVKQIISAPPVQAVRSPAIYKMLVHTVSSPEGSARRRREETVWKSVADFRTVSELSWTTEVHFNERWPAQQVQLATSKSSSRINDEGRPRVLDPLITQRLERFLAELPDI